MIYTFLGSLNLLLLPGLGARDRSCSSSSSDPQIPEQPISASSLTELALPTTLNFFTLSFFGFSGKTASPPRESQASKPINHMSSRGKMKTKKKLRKKKKGNAEEIQRSTQEKEITRKRLYPRTLYHKANENIQKTTTMGSVVCVCREREWTRNEGGGFSNLSSAYQRGACVPIA